jgi:hypothetical protein
MIEKIRKQMRGGPALVRYADLFKICESYIGESYFGEPRRSGSRHAAFKTPWRGERVAGSSS